jgi:hypothetical protein
VGAKPESAPASLFVPASTKCNGAVVPSLRGRGAPYEDGIMSAADMDLKFVLSWTQKSGCETPPSNRIV